MKVVVLGASGGVGIFRVRDTDPRRLRRLPSRADVACGRGANLGATGGPRTSPITETRP